MKVLWLVNIIMPELAEILGRERSSFGGWLEGAQNVLLTNSFSMVVCTSSTDTKLVGRYFKGDTVYYVVDGNSISRMQDTFARIIHEENPDLIHIYGTEFAQSWALFTVANRNKTIITLQGLLFLCSSKVYADIPYRYCRDSIFHKILRLLHRGGNSIELQKKSFDKRIPYERQIIESAKYINGLSDWGNAGIRAINKECELIPCGSVLRNEFYDGTIWNVNSCEPHSICCIYSYPIKGFHKLIEALEIVRRYYPDVKVYAIAKSNPYRIYSGIKKFVMDLAPDYEWYVQSLIEKYDLKENIIFPGLVSAGKMKEFMLKSNVFVSASSVENQSTAIGEAMLLGVPTVISCVGDAENMIAHGQEGFIYSFDQTQMLAYYICEIFNDKSLASRISAGAHEKASVLFGKEENGKLLLDMYDKVIQLGERNLQ